MPDIAPEVIEIADLMFRHRLRSSAMAKRAGLRPNTWSSWANGASPNIKNLRAFRQAVMDAIAEQTPEGE